MNRSASRQRHEKARKQHRHEMMEHAREAAKQPRSKAPAYILGVGVTVLLAIVIGATFWK